MDLVDVSRIEEAMRHPRFIRRILTPKEREYCVTAEQVAGRWAAKEAIVKAVGKSIGLTWQQVEILPNELGVPSPRLDTHKFDPIRYRLHVTITHERSHAAAVAILERLVFQAPVP